jgi:CubicO group peptidase (beta-lactamase class C family)
MPSEANASAAQSVKRFLSAAWPEDAGGSVVVARAREMVICEGLGSADEEAKIAAGCDTVYDIASMTKQFTAAGILKLRMMGRIELTDPISEYLGPVPDDKRTITLHHLLTHSAGLRESLGGDYERLSRDQMVKAALESELVSTPGEEYHYSNVGFSLLAALIEIASGQGYEEFSAANLFALAGMTRTGYVLPAWNPDEVAVEYDNRGRPQGRPFDRPWDTDGPYWNLRGNGGLLSTARDLFSWHQALLGHQILDQGAKAVLFKPHVAEVEGDSYYGYGWVIASTSIGAVAWHNGGNGLSYGEILRSLDGSVMVFWVSNHAYQNGEWDLGKQGRRLTDGITELLV